MNIITYDPLGYRVDETPQGVPCASFAWKNPRLRNEHGDF